MGRPRTEAPELRRKRIIEAARYVLIEKGYRDLSMDDVARKAGIASGTVYLYFKDKWDLVAAVFIDLFDRLEARLEEIPTRGSALNRLRLIARETLEFMDEHHDFFAQAPRPDWKQKESGQRFRERFMRHLDYIGRRLADCMSESALRPYDHRLASHYFMSVCRIFMINKYALESTEPLVSKVDACMDLFLNGLGSRAGGVPA